MKRSATARDEAELLSKRSLIYMTTASECEGYNVVRVEETYVDQCLALINHDQQQVMEFRKIHYAVLLGGG